MLGQLGRHQLHDGIYLKQTAEETRKAQLRTPRKGER